ncbi:syntaxin-binding protein 4 [Lissotriton helveticus]
MATSTQATNGDGFHTILVTKGTSLGLSIMGGVNRSEGPLVYVQEVIPGQDCHKDGRLRPGDQLVFINKESMIGVTYEEAKSILNRAKLRREPTWEIGFIRHKSISNNEESSLALNTLAAPLEEIQNQMAPSSFSTSVDRFDPKTASTPGAMNKCQTKTSFVKTDWSPIIPTDSSTLAVSPCVVSPNRTGEEKLQLDGRKISLNPNVRVKVEKLEMALNYLGIQPTDEQQQALRQQMKTYSEGTVSFGDFVKAARSVFHLQLDEAGLSPGPMSAAHEINNLLEPTSSQVLNNDTKEPDETETLRRERNEALREINKLKKTLFESENYAKQLSEELQNVKQEAKAAVEETKALRSRIHLAEAAQKQAHGMELDYEEVIGLLENEITELKAQLAGDHSGQNKDSVQDLRKRITVLDCQLRKSEVARKTFEASTEKLLHFVEVVHEVLADNLGSMTNLSDRRLALSSQSILARFGRNGRTVSATLAVEANDLAKSVRSAVEEDCLPYGWEEAFTADGIKFFINHVTQTTSWTHPVTSALRLSCSDDHGEDYGNELPEPRS